MFTILFVCTGNTCRSAMAEGIMKDIIANDEELKHIQVISAGTSVYFSGHASSGAVSALEEKKIDISKHVSKPVMEDVIKNADLVLTMTMSHKLRVLGMVPEAREKTFTLKEFSGDADFDIFDPYGFDVEEYKKCASEIHDALIKAIQKIKAMKS